MPRPILVFDTECFQNYFLLMFRNVESGKITYFELSDTPSFDVDKIRKILGRYRVIGFNSIHYDFPLLFLALSNPDTTALKRASDAIILNNIRSWQLEADFRFVIPKDGIDHIDLIEVAPGKASLKSYGGRLHSARLQDLPIDPAAFITKEDEAKLREYCANDLKITEDLYRRLLPQLELREKMSEEYQQNLRSKSDAQIAEAVIKARIESVNKRRLQRPAIEAGTTFRYTPPEFISFRTPEMQSVLNTMKDTVFTVTEGGKIACEPDLTKKHVEFCGKKYRLGIGGLHSSEEKVSYQADGTWEISDFDVKSYYPAIILNCNLAPAHLGKDFLDLYRALTVERLSAKAAKDDIKANSYKILINGSFGKLGSRYSILFSPHLLVQTTLTGQLSLLMLIERLSPYGEVISANTDGVTVYFKREKRKFVEGCIEAWQRETGFDTEETGYRAIYFANVNNYIALKTDGGVKLKGAYTSPGLQKNPMNEICTEAGIAFLRNRTPLAQTVFACRDIRKFLTVRMVTGGAVKNGEILGKTVRWYYKEGETGTINYKLNGNIVPRTLGAKPCMELPGTFPEDVDHEWYVSEAQSILSDIGYA